MTAEGKEETLLLEALTEENSINITVDDDIIFASQGERHQKIKAVKKVQCIKENYNLSNIDLLKSADINNQTVGGYKNSSPTDEKTISLPFNKSADENATNNTQSIFVSPFSCSWDHKLPNITQNIDLKKDITAGTYYLGSSIKIKNHESQRSAILLSKHNTENVVRNGNFNALLSSLQKNKTFCNSDRKSEENLAKDISQVLSTEDYTYCKKGSTSHEEVLTSGIILSTQPKLQFNAKKNFKHGLQSSECFVIKNKVSQNPSFVEENKPFNLETNTINFALSVSCFVVTDKSTNEIMDKFILSVTELPKSSKQVTQKPEYIKSAGSEKSALQNSHNTVPILTNTRGKFVETSASERNDTMLLKHFQEGEKPIRKIQWTNEYLLPLKLDELLNNFLENSNEPRLASPQSSFEKSEIEKFYKNVDVVKEDMELFPSETNISYRKCKDRDEKFFVEENTQDLFRSKDSEFLEPFNNRFIEIPNVKNFNHKKQLYFRVAGRKEESRSGVSKFPTRRTSAKRINRMRKRKIRLVQGQSVLARQTIEQYCPGILIRNIRGDCWRVKFNGGIIKTVSGDRILPWKWLQKGDLVLVLIDNKYCPGKIIDKNSGNEVSYTVKLEDDCSKIIVTKTHLSLTEAMADILKKRFSLLKPRIPLVNFPSLYD